MRSLYKILFLVISVNFSFTFAYSSNKVEESPILKTVASPSGQITGNATICLNSTPNPLIKFEVADDNNEPYTFSYTINGGVPLIIKTNSIDKSVTVTAPTNVAGNFEYILTSVKDKDSKDVAISSNDKVTIKVNPLPDVNFTFTNNACSGAAVQFNTTSNGNTYTWNFGNGDTSSLQNPSHIFTSLGCGTKTFTVILTISDFNGCSSSITKIVTINQQPDISFYDINDISNQNKLMSFLLV